MEKVTGIGGVFFRGSDPDALRTWYEQHLGVTQTPTDYDQQPWYQAAGPTILQPFPSDTTYFDRPSQGWMINFRVANLDALVSQLRASGIEVVVDPETYPNGRFARLHDPEGNPVELWEPQGKRADIAGSLDHVELFVPDRLEAARWYERVLGLTIIDAYRAWADDPRGPLMISSDDGETKLALFVGQPQGAKETAGFHRVAFRIHGGGFLGFLSRLPDLALSNQAGRPVTGDAIVDHTKAYSIYFSDPYGHRLELTTYDHEVVRQALSGSPRPVAAS